MKILLVALFLCFSGCVLDVGPDPVGECECYAYGQPDYYGNFPFGIGYGYTADEACANAINLCVSAAPDTFYLPCIVEGYDCY